MWTLRGRSCSYKLNFIRVTSDAWAHCKLIQRAVKSRVKAVLHTAVKPRSSFMFHLHVRVRQKTSFCSDTCPDAHVSLLVICIVCIQVVRPYVTVQYLPPSEYAISVRRTACTVAPYIHTHYKIRQNTLQLADKIRYWMPLRAGALKPFSATGGRGSRSKIKFYHVTRNDDFRHNG